MIAYVSGTLEYIFEDSVIIDVGGIGYHIRTTGYVLDHLPELHREILLYTYMYVREDEMSLYGFSTMEQLDIFKKLINISGIGPKAGLSILTALTVDELKMAVISNDVKAITKANGVGSKGAQRIIIELKDKLKLDDFTKAITLEAEEALSSNQNAVQDAISALVSLQYSSSQAIKAIRSVAGYEDMTVDELIKAALKNIV